MKSAGYQLNASDLNVVERKASIKKITFFSSFYFLSTFVAFAARKTNFDTLCNMQCYRDGFNAKPWQKASIFSVFFYGIRECFMH